VFLCFLLIKNKMGVYFSVRYSNVIKKHHGKLWLVGGGGGGGGGGDGGYI
jgi:hypothetical protein